MVTHPNRGKGKPERNPTPDELRAFRAKHNLTAEKAASLIYCSLRAWNEWESSDAGARRMHPAFWELLQIKIAKGI